MMHLELQPSCGASRTELPVGKYLGTPVAESPRLSLSLRTGQPDIRSNPPDYSKGTLAKACKGTNSPDCAHHSAQRFSQTRHPVCPDPEPKPPHVGSPSTVGPGAIKNRPWSWPILERSPCLTAEAPLPTSHTKKILASKYFQGVLF